MGDARTEGGSSPPGIVVSRAEQGDLDALARLEEASFAGDRMSRRSYRRLLGRPSAVILVARAETGAVLGSLVLLFRKGSPTARVYSVAVDPAARKGGVGRRLMAAAERTAAERGACAIRLEVRADNAAALRLYEALGYGVADTVPGYYADGEAAIRMIRPLGPAGGTA